jgi:Carboxypeptidase regulatory-like domain
MRLELVRHSVFFLLFGMVLVCDMLSQTTTSGALAGVIIDQTKAVVPDATVEITDIAKGTNQSSKTNAEGVYQFFFLTPGRYTLTLSHAGFREEKRAVNVTLGPAVTVNVTLEIAKANSELTVVDDPPLVQAENGDVSATMNQQQISEAPNPGNDLTYIVQTTPGAVMSTDSSVNTLGHFSILGMPGESYHYTIDGMDSNENSNNQSMTGSLGLALGQNQVQEATIVSTGYSSQFGDAAGGNINYITKSGSREFHGNAQYYWNGRVLNANDWFNKAFGNPRPFSIANQWAGSFGGPIRKGKLFFFFDSEGLRLLIPQIYFVTIPSTEFETATMANIDSKFGSASASHSFYRQIFDLYEAAPAGNKVASGISPADLGCAGFSLRNGLGTTIPCSRSFIKTRDRPSQDALTSGRVDWNLGNSDRAFFRIQGEHGLGAFSSDAINSIFDADYDVSLWQGQLVETHTFGSTAASQFLVAGSDYYFAWNETNPSRALSAFPTFLNFYSTGAFSPLGGANWIGAYGIDMKRYQLSEDVIKTKGGHKLGLGASFQRTWWKVPRNTVNAVGQVSPQTLDAFYQGGFDSVSRSVDFTSLTQSFTSQSSVPVSFLHYSFYGQDEWRARTNLTFSLGLRIEHYSTPSCATGCFAKPAGPFDSISHDPAQPYSKAILLNEKHAFSTDNILWSPRFSFAWQPFGISHNGVLRGGVGLFYDRLQDALAESFYINAPIYNVYTVRGNNLTPNETTSLFKDAATSNAAFVSGFDAGETLAQIQASNPNFAPPSLNTSAMKMHAPQYQKWSLEWQQAFGTKTTTSLGYFGHHGIHELVVNPSANAFGFASFPAGQCSGSRVAPCSDRRFAQVSQYSTNAISNYNGIVISLRRQFSRLGNGLVQFNYTYGHALDEVSNGGLFGFTGGGSVYPQDPNNLRGAYGPAEYDVRHSFNANYVWELPIKAAFRGRGPAFLVNGWQLSGTIFGRTGFPYTVFDRAMSGNLSQNDYFSLMYAVPAADIGSGTPCGRDATIIGAAQPCQPPQSLPDGSPNPNANFIQAGCETGFDTGNLPGPTGPCSGPAVSFGQGRNRFRGPAYFNTDLAVMKRTIIPGWEGATIGIGFQFFNLLNHPNFGFPINESSDPYFGQIPYLEQPPTSILGSNLGGDVSPRMIQLKAELKF